MGKSKLEKIKQLTSGVLDEVVSNPERISSKLEEITENPIATKLFDMVKNYKKEENQNVKKITADVYKKIEDTANSNVVVQGITGLVGFPFTLIADGAVILTHYAPMISEIRLMYGREPIESESIVPIVKSILNEVLFDVVADKVLGNIPLVGIYFNAICAKTMTWRLGILFAMISSRGEKINEKKLKDAIFLIRKVFPQEDTFKFKQPSYSAFLKLITSVFENSEEEYERKIDKALNAFK